MSEIYNEREGTQGNNSLGGLKWFAAYTATHHEKQVLEQLMDRRIDSYLPLYKAARHWKKRASVTLDLPLFPNYVFVHIDRSQKGAVLGTPGVYSIVGSGKKAWELPPQEIEALRSGLHERKVKPHPYLSVGNRARIRSGFMEGIEGVIVRETNSLCLVLSLDQIMQSISIEVAPEELEPIARPAQRAPQGLAGYTGRALCVA